MCVKLARTNNRDKYRGVSDIECRCVFFFLLLDIPHRAIIERRKELGTIYHPFKGKSLTSMVVWPLTSHCHLRIGVGRSGRSVRSPYTRASICGNLRCDLIDRDPFRRLLVALVACL